MTKKKRVLQIGKYSNYWVIKGMYNTSLEEVHSVDWRFIEVEVEELNYLDFHHIDDWLEKLWKKDLIKQELRIRKEVKSSLQDMFTLLH